MYELIYAPKFKKIIVERFVIPRRPFREAFLIPFSYYKKHIKSIMLSL